MEARLLEAGALTVARREGEIWMDLVLPEPVYSREAE